MASVFVSRLDAVADRLLETIGSPDALALRGRIAIANARQVYRRFRELFGGEPFAGLERRGARVQRPLWASTGTKNAVYSDVLYIEALIGPDTVTTVAPTTLDAFRDHGRVRATLGTDDEQNADAVIASAAALGLDLHEITEQLQADGIEAFADSFDRLVGAVGETRRRILTAAASGQR